MWQTNLLEDALDDCPIWTTNFVASLATSTQLPEDYVKKWRKGRIRQKSQRVDRGVVDEYGGYRKKRISGSVYLKIGATNVESGKSRSEKLCDNKKEITSVSTLQDSDSCRLTDFSGPGFCELNFENEQHEDFLCPNYYEANDESMWM